VRDSGVGIEPDHLGRIFEMFAQPGTPLERAEGGLGIGLALARALVEMHDGTIEAHSEGSDAGSEFVVRLPACAPPSDVDLEAPDAPSPARATQRLRILVADDNQDSADALGILLGLAGHDVRTAHDGVAAWTTASDFRPDVALLDIGMPLANGYEVARRIRLEPWGGTVVLIAITGWGQREDKQRAAAAGFDHHLTKPVDAAALEALMASVPARGIQP
jgi:CheY-like chemotaxis protein